LVEVKREVKSFQAAGRAQNELRREFAKELEGTV
jgi:hypothetical protein